MKIIQIKVQLILIHLNNNFDLKKYYNIILWITTMTLNNQNKFMYQN